ncbi:MAG: DinB family protein [Planctomycetota bacterium]
MNSKDALNYMLVSTQHMVPMFLKDLDDADIQVRPVPGANNIAWQIGHLIASETQLGGMLGIKYAELPPVIQALGKASSSQTHGDGGNLAKDHYLKLFNQVRETTIAGLAKIAEEELDKPAPDGVSAMAPKLGNIIGLIANHSMMHCGQFTVVRRLLNKPVLF